MSLRQRWRELKEQNRIESDERARTISLLALRDAFFAVMSLIGALVLIVPIFGWEQINAAAPEIVVLFPLVAIMVAGTVIVISAAFRGGIGLSRGAAAYQGTLQIIGVLIGLGTLAVLSSLFDFGPSLGSSWMSMLGVIVGVVVGAIALVFVSGRRNR